MQSHVLSVESVLLFFLFSRQNKTAKELKLKTKKQTQCSPVFRLLLQKHHRRQKQSSVGGMRRLRFNVHIAVLQVRIKITNELLDVRKFLVEIVKPKRKCF